MKIVLVTNIPSPYRVIVYDEIALKYGEDFHVIYCAAIEKNRKWKLPEIHHQHTFLKAKRIRKTIYYKSDVLKQLRSLVPEILIISGFTPVAIYARIYAKVRNIKVIEFTDTWLHSIKHLTVFHKILRQLFLKQIDAAICSSQKGKDYLALYGVERNVIFLSPLVIENDKFHDHVYTSKQYHVMFSGQFIERKMPFFFINICIELKKQIEDFKVLLIGDGPLKSDIMKKLTEANILYDYPGFIQQEDLPSYYSKSSIFLFPTKFDPWGLVANEACAAGVPVITCNNAGVGNELVINDYNGYVLPLEVKTWVEKTFELLVDSEKYKIFSKNCLEIISRYTIDESVKGFINAIDFTYAKK